MLYRTRLAIHTEISKLGKVEGPGQIRKELASVATQACKMLLFARHLNKLELRSTESTVIASHEASISPEHQQFTASLSTSLEEINPVCDGAALVCKQDVTVCGLI